VDAAFVLAGDSSIETNGRHVPAKAYLRSPYDAERERILG
jgi:hypothetical protein